MIGGAEVRESCDLRTLRQKDRGARTDRSSARDSFSEPHALKARRCYDTHAAAGAKLVDFAAGNAAHLRSQIEEHHAVRACRHVRRFA